MVFLFFFFVSVFLDKDRRQVRCTVLHGRGEIRFGTRRIFASFDERTATNRHGVQVAARPDHGGHERRVQGRPGGGRCRSRAYDQRY